MPRKKKPLKNMKGRPRGGASMPCPTCGADSHVVITRRDEEQSHVLRKRECNGRSHHMFSTMERVVG